MNYCTSCGNKLAEGTVFCPKCGTQVVDMGAVSLNESPKSSSNEMKEQLTNTYENTRKLVKKSKYPEYFVNALKRPTSALDSTESSHGWIQAVLFAIVSTLTMYGIITGTVKIATRELSFMSFMGVNSSVFSLIRSQLVPRLFMVSLVTFLTFILSAFIVLKVAGNANKSFSQLLTEFSGLFSPNIVALFAIAIVTLIFASEVTVGLSAMVLVLSFLLFFAAYNYYLYSRIHVGKLDKMYTMLLSNLLIVILLVVLIYIQVEPIITLIDQISRF